MTNDNEAELLALLKSIRPQYGTVGSRDKDVTELRAKIDHAIRLLSTAQQVQADAGAVHPDHLELLRPFMSARDGRLTHSLTVYLREMADPEFAKRTHEARKRLYGAAAESDKRAVLTDFDERINAAIEAVEDQDNHAALAILRTMLAQHQTRQQDDRAAFEVIAKEQCLPLSRVGITYDDISTQAAWAVYRKARAAMSREQSGGGE